MGKKKNPETPKALTKKDRRRVNKRSPGAKLKIRANKFSNEFKSKAKTRLQLWKEDCLEQNLTALREFCGDAKVSDELLKSATYILGDLSISSQTDDVEQDANLFKDLDLAIFGADHETYTEYKENLQMEYRHLNDSSFKSIRLKILETFLKIPAIFSTPEFHQRFESTARSNIQREIMQLKN